MSDHETLADVLEKHAYADTNGCNCGRADCYDYEVWVRHASNEVLSFLQRQAEREDVIKEVAQEAQLWPCIVEATAMEFAKHLWRINASAMTVRGLP